MNLFGRVCLLAWIVAAGTAGAEVVIEKDLSYLGPDRAEKMDLYRPKADPKPGEKRPGIVIIHGGGWTGGDKGAKREINIGTTLAEHGYVCISINYVLASKGHPTWPENVKDCKRAVRWLRRNADKYAIDADHIGAIGGSAGGHLTAMLAVAGPEVGLEPEEDAGLSSRVQAAVPMYAHMAASMDRDHTMFPATKAEDPAMYLRATPATHVTRDDAPMLLLHGTADKTTPLNQSQRFAAKLAEVGVEHQLVIVEGAPHSFDLKPKQRDLRPLVLEFFDKHLKPPAADKKAAGMFGPPPALVGDLGAYRSPLKFEDGRPVRDASDWAERRSEIRAAWHAAMGAWPPLIEAPKVERLETVAEQGYTRQKLRVEVAPDRTVDGYWLRPEGQGPFPAMLVVFYEPETAVGIGGKPRRDFARQLAKDGIAALSIGFDPRVIDPNKSGIAIQPLSYLAYVASNALTAMRGFPDADRDRIGVMGHSYGGKWAMFAACLDDRFACGVWSDPGVAFDEARPNVNYWDPWYLGWEPGQVRKKGPISESNPRTGAYKRLVAEGRDLHEFQALMAPRPFLVSGGAEDGPGRWTALNHVVAVNDTLGVRDRVAMTYRPMHDPTEESNARIVGFLREALKAAP
ncbi:prolyl oligopeptidase family serine peptidase [Tundrisphaera sp. TA3]|uniref:prolyl oligopeptidase family serine peptidase n=1 Tax=Tundrisphaera sp. TA3 TaxID=3435775 RepID=UPI003EBD3D7B